MPDFIRSILIKITSYGWIAALAGIGLFAFSFYAQYKASDAHAYVAQDKLAKIAGKVTSATEVTVTSKSRRGGSRVSDRYYEIDVSPASGAAQKLRLHLSVGRSNVESIIDEQITAQYDAEDNNIVYDVHMGDKAVLAYETTKARLQASAESTAKSFGGAATMAGFVALFLVGCAGMFFNRKLRQQGAQAEATVAA